MRLKALIPMSFFLASSALAEVPESLVAAVSDMSTSDADIISYADITANGYQDGFIVFSETCGSSVGCQWALVSETDGTPEVVMRRFSPSPELLDAFIGRAALKLDGIPYHFYDGEIYPAPSNIPQSNWRPATNAEIDTVVAQSDFKTRSEMRIMVLDEDVTGNGRPDKIMSIEGLYYAMMGGSYFPVLVFSHGGNLIFSNYSLEGPIVYKFDDEVSVLANTPAGYVSLRF
jgi:hypothetical protein